MRLTGRQDAPFDTILPVYNWYYPLSGDQLILPERKVEFFRDLPVDGLSGRALYFHIPFCDTICTFCPFVRKAGHSSDDLDAYVDALIREIEVKVKYDSVTKVPIRSIFVGGGTPSLLTPKHIRRLGASINKNFDLASDIEWSFEFEVKSATEERMEALKEIGVTHARFGAQTFDPTYRSLFNLTASLDEVERAASLLPKYFPYVSCDILYGMDGQSPEQFLNDIDSAVGLGLANIDFYPINNAVTQPALHKEFRRGGLQPTSEFTKHCMNILLREAIKGHGYLPHNGHGYVRATDAEILRNPVTVNSYSFKYHEHVYGYQGFDLIGFGVNAISSTSGYSIFNTAHRERYVRNLLSAESWDFSVTNHRGSLDASRPVVLHLPYHGHIDVDRVSWEQVDPNVVEKLEEVTQAGMVERTEHSYRLTEIGWRWYVNLMYYLAPLAEQTKIDGFIRSQSMQGGRRLGDIAIAD